MNPEAIRTVSHLRSEFYSRFAAKMKVPVKITTRNPSTGNLPTASWVDERQRMNYVCIYAYTAPDALLPKRPFILRVSVNKGAGIVQSRLWGKDCRGLNQSWHFDLTLLPEEILDFCTWIVSLIKSHNKGSVSFVPEPPHPFDFTMANNELLVNEAWTQKARQESKVIL
ncbi:MULTISPECIES: hypothetical protein [unclassified Coleofasciculus]|uniref:hypothetical protein n=1 Tax=unclassified Coleofasciculus TaxID=2692782 RepID=UPI001882B40D|nr:MULTISPECIES: hypothetical protein [unclassified Coleofasciculus]MBE9127175.1 hypothetical protein [Coleofasciculus sp. LEGE 07081]MBE9150496.1 hypothetical protein [Coleofasciculus sp. LEGE 07092]